MRSYQEITLLPNPEVGLNFLWSKVFQQLHLGFVENQNLEKRLDIGVSFPQYWIEGAKFGLGSKCRLFSTDEGILERFDAPGRLSRLSDYAHCTSIRPVPEKVASYAVYRREQPKTNPERLARRYARRHGLDFQAAFNNMVELRMPVGDAAYPTAFRYCDMTVRSVALPFIRLQSLSGGQTFCLWIKKTVVESPVVGDFGCYGLSASTTVPEF